MVEKGTVGIWKTLELLLDYSSNIINWGNFTNFPLSLVTNESLSVNLPNLFVICCIFVSLIHSCEVHNVISKWEMKVMDSFSFFLSFFKNISLKTQELTHSQSVRPDSFNARAERASRSCGDVMEMMTAPTAAMRRIVVSSLYRVFCVGWLNTMIPLLVASWSLNLPWHIVAFLLP